MIKSFMHDLINDFYWLAHVRLSSQGKVLRYLKVNIQVGIAMRTGASRRTFDVLHVPT